MNKRTIFFKLIIYDEKWINHPLNHLKNPSNRIIRETTAGETFYDNRDFVILCHVLLSRHLFHISLVPHQATYYFICYPFLSCVTPTFIFLSFNHFYDIVYLLQFPDPLVTYFCPLKLYIAFLSPLIFVLFSRDFLNFSQVIKPMHYHYTLIIYSLYNLYLNIMSLFLFNLHFCHLTTFYLISLISF